MTVFKKWFQGTYCYRLSKFRGLFLGVLFFVAANSYLSVRNVEIPPFYQWAMYSVPVKKSDTATTYLLLYNGLKVFNTGTFLKHQQSMLFHYTIRKYAYFQRNGLQQSPFGRWPCNPETEARALAAYPVWLKNYLTSALKEKITQLDVYEVKVAYGPNKKVRLAAYSKLISL